MTVITTPPTRRFPNSTKACTFFSGRGAPRSHPGQWLQPRPESVSRTAAPVPTISQRRNTFVHATWTKRTGEISKLRMRAAISI